MKNRKANTVLASVLCACMLLAPVSANAANTKTADDYFSTSFGSYNDEVTLGLKLDKNSRLTSAQTVIYYDPTVMKLYDVTDVSGIGLTDINSDYRTEDGRTGVSFAWSADKEVTKGGQVLTLVFKVKNAKTNQKVTVETDTVSAYKDGVELAQGDKTIVDSLKLSIPKNVNKTEEKIVKTVNKIVNVFKGIFGRP